MTGWYKQENEVERHSFETDDEQYEERVKSETGNDICSGCGELEKNCTCM